MLHLSNNINNNSIPKQIMEDHQILKMFNATIVKKCLRPHRSFITGEKKIKTLSPVVCFSVQNKEYFTNIE